MAPLDIGCAIYLAGVMVVLALIGYIGEAIHKKRSANK